MLRGILYLLIVVVVLTLVRAFRIIVGQAFRASMDSGPKEKEQTRVPGGGKLHKDPVCGTYVTEAVPYRIQRGGETLYFCSEKCLKAHTGQQA